MDGLTIVATSAAAAPVRPPLDLSDPTSALILGLGALLLIYLLVLRPRMQKRRRDPLEKPRPTVSLSQERSLERSMQTLLLDMETMNRQMGAQLDTKIARLEKLLQRAEKADEILEEKLAKVTSTVAAPLARAAVAPRGPLDRPAGAYDAIYDLADAGRSPGDVAAAVGRPRGEVELILSLRGAAGRKVAGSQSAASTSIVRPVSAER